LEANIFSYPRFPLLAWLAGLVRHVEGDLVALLARAAAEEVVPLFFQRVQRAARSLPSGWRPGIEVPEAQLLDLRRISEDAAAKYRHAHEERCRHETHAALVSTSLDRTASRLQEAMKAAVALGAAVDSGPATASAA